MLNPIPFTYNGWKKALASIVHKVPESLLKKIDFLATQPDCGVELFQTIYPYYTGNENIVLPREVSFDIHACNAISEKISNFDHRGLVNSILIPLIRISGGQDPFLDDQETLSDHTIIIPNAGHYPFFETPVKFSEAVKKAGEFLCR